MIDFKKLLKANRTEEEPVIYFFGCDAKAPGHYLFDEFMATVYPFQRLTPFGYIDGIFAPREKPKDWDGQHPARHYWPEVEEGIAGFHQIDGWSLIAFWDRSGDSRPGSNTAFIVNREMTFEELVSISKKAFPDIWKRFTFEVRSVEAAAMEF